MTTRPVPNSITLADLDGIPAPTALIEAAYSTLVDEELALFHQHLPLWDSHPDRPLYQAVELFAAMYYAGQEYFNGQIAQFDPRNLSGSNLQLIGALFGVLKKMGESDPAYLLRVINRNVENGDTGTYIGLVAAMLAYPDLNIVSAHAAVETTNRDVYNCYALKADENGAKVILTDAERAAFASYTAPVGDGQPMTSGYLNARNRADFGKFYRVQAVQTVTYTVAIKVFYDDTLHTQATLDSQVRDTVIAWAFSQDLIGEELRPRRLEAMLIEGNEGVFDARATFTTDPVIAADADGVFPGADARHYRGPRAAERATGIALTYEVLS